MSNRKLQEEIRFFVFKTLFALGMFYKEIAELTGWSTSTIKNDLKEKEFPDRPRTKAGKYQSVLRQFAKLYTNQKTKFNREYKKLKLQEMLGEWLQVRYLLEHIQTAQQVFCGVVKETESSKKTYVLLHFMEFILHQEETPDSLVKTRSALLQFLKLRFDQSSTSDAPIESLQLSFRAYASLKEAGIDSIADLQSLVQKNDLELLKIENFGRKSHKEVKDRMEERGIELVTTEG